MIKKLTLCGAFFFLSIMTFSQINFVEKSNELGLNFSCGDTDYGNGVSFVDYNGDGWDDITLSTDVGIPIKIYINNDGNSFTDANLNILSSNTMYKTKSVHWVDIDNDGDKDLYVTSDTNGNKLFLNDGSLVFSDITNTSGLPTVNIKTYSSSWGDINNDGFLDVFISNRDELRVETNYLYLNNGNGTFQDISVSAGIYRGSNLTFCSAFFDFNNDGFQDIYVINDKYHTANILYKNNGNNTFTNVSISSNSNIAIDAMTSTIGDFNNDGWFDIYITNSPSGNVLLRNNGDETFTDIATSSGTIYDSVGWSSVFLDAENDGDLDLYVSGSLDGSNPSYLSAAFYENNGNETFNLPTNVGFNGDTKESYCNAIGDVNNDGLPDILVNNGGNENISLWKNQTSTTNNWLKVNLEGTTSNKDGIGSVIEISINGNKQYRYTLCGENYLSQNSSSEFFGLGANTTIDYVKVTWLSGIEDVLYTVTSNQSINIVEGSTLSLAENNINQISIYPNPVNETLFFNEFFNGELELLNVLGQSILKENNFNSNTLNCSLLKSGVYILKLESNQYSKDLKFIKL